MRERKKNSGNSQKAGISRNMICPLYYDNCFNLYPQEYISLLCFFAADHDDRGRACRRQRQQQIQTVITAVSGSCCFFYRSSLYIRAVTCTGFLTIACTGILAAIRIFVTIGVLTAIRILIAVRVLSILRFLFIIRINGSWIIGFVCCCIVDGNCSCLLYTSDAADD